MDLLNIPYSTSLDYTSNQLLASSDSYTCNCLSLLRKAFYSRATWEKTRGGWEDWTKMKARATQEPLRRSVIAASSKNYNIQVYV